MRSHSLEFEFEVPDDDAEDGLRVVTVEAEVKVSPYDAGKCYGDPNSCYPPEGGEVEIDSVKIDGKLWPENEWPKGLAEEIERQAAENERDWQDSYDDY
ncbi:MAG: hypothetical protein ABFE07_16250 [Armatimonadia bacterium]